MTNTVRMPAASASARATQTTPANKRTFPTLRTFLALWAIGTFGPLIVLIFDKDPSFLIESLKLYPRIFASVISLSVAAAAVLFGYSIFTNYPNTVRSARDINWKFTLATWALALVAILLLMGSSPAAILATANALMSKVRNAAKYQNMIYFLLPIVIFQSCFLSLAAIQGSSKKQLNVAILVALTSAVLSLAVGSRLNAVMVLLVPSIYFSTRRGIKPAALVVCLIAVITLVYAGDIMRSTAQKRDLRKSSSSAAATFLSAYSIVDPMAVVLDLRERVHPNAVESTVTLIRWALPSKWVGAKEPIGPIVARYVYYHDVLGGITFGVFGEFYYYYGYVGLVLLSTLFGVALGWLSLRSGENSVYGATCTMFISTLLFSSIRDGLFIDALNVLMLALICGAHILLAKHRQPAGLVVRQRFARNGDRVADPTI